MIRQAALGLALAGAALPVAAAEGGKVRGGEHGDFSRVVLTIEPTTEWSLETVARRATIRFPGKALAFDPDGVFAKMPATRILAVRTSVDAGGTTVVVDLGCDCRVSTSFVDARYLALDVGDRVEAPAVAAETPEARTAARDGGGGDGGAVADPADRARRRPGAGGDVGGRARCSTGRRSGARGRAGGAEASPVPEAPPAPDVTEPPALPRPPGADGGGRRDRAAERAGSDRCDDGLRPRQPAGDGAHARMLPVPSACLPDEDLDVGLVERAAAARRSCRHAPPVCRRVRRAGPGRRPRSRPALHPLRLRGGGGEPCDRLRRRWPWRTGRCWLTSDAWSTGVRRPRAGRWPLPALSGPAWAVAGARRAVAGVSRRGGVSRRSRRRSSRCRWICGWRWDPVRRAAGRCVASGRGAVDL